MATWEKAPSPNGKEAPASIEYKTEAQSEISKFLDELEGRKWDDLEENEKEKLLVAAAAEDLDEEDAERLKAIVPTMEEMNDEDKVLYLDTMEKLGLVKKEERE